MLNGDEQMKDYFQGLVILLLAIPFIYMAYDVCREVLKKSYVLVTTKTKPFIKGITNFLFD
jgi:hypothetical protein